jgi:hypothetical protein
MMIQRQSIEWQTLFQTTVGIFFSILLGFFVLKIAIGALNLATSYGEKDALKKFKEILTSAIKGVVIALGGLIITNTILGILSLNKISDPLSAFTDAAQRLETCIRYYSECGTNKYPKK